MNNPIDIYDYLTSRILESVSIYEDGSRITVSWLEGRRVRSISRAYTPEKAERVCEALVNDVHRAMGY